MFIGAGLFFRTLIGMRVLWLAGRFGGGKTLLSFALADWLRKQSYCESIFSNIPSELTQEIEPPLKDAAVIFDEAWILLDAREWNKNIGRTIGAYLRKLNLYLLLPSVFPVDKRFRNFFVQRVLNCYAFGFPAYVYKWGLKMGYLNESGIFALWQPSRYFGSYDHLATPSDDGGIVQAMQETLPTILDLEGEWTGDVGEYREIEEGVQVEQLQKAAKGLKSRRR